MTNVIDEMVDIVGYTDPPEPPDGYTVEVRRDAFLGLVTGYRFVLLPKSNCEICGHPMPEGEEMFKFHGYSGECPTPPLTMKTARSAQDDMIEALQAAREYFDNRADADCDQDGYIPNKEMILLSLINEALSKADGRNRRLCDVCDKSSTVFSNSRGNVTLTNTIEEIIIRRVHENKVDGYTLGMAKEIAALIGYGEAV